MTTKLIGTLLAISIMLNLGQATSTMNAADIDAAGRQCLSVAKNHQDFLNNEKSKGSAAFAAARRFVGDSYTQALAVMKLPSGKLSALDSIGIKVKSFTVTPPDLPQCDDNPKTDCAIKKVGYKRLADALSAQTERK